jgi:predicted nucleotidyltransferase
VALASHSVEFVIIGGVAISLHSSGYLTYDIDFCFSRKRENLRRISTALSAFKPKLRGFPDELPFIWDEQTLAGGTSFTLKTSIGDIDLLGEVAGVGDFDAALMQSVAFDMFGYEVRVLTIEALIKAKRAAGRTKDLLILPELEALLELQNEEKEEAGD